MRLVFASTGWKDYLHWQSADRAMLKKVNRLIEAVLRDPFEGIGKPEQLKHNLTGTWSRRITEEHRLVYVVDDEDVIIIGARFHYDD